MGIVEVLRILSRKLVSQNRVRISSFALGKKFAQMLELVHTLKLRVLKVRNWHALKARDMAKEWNPSFGLGRNPRAGGKQEMRF